MGRNFLLQSVHTLDSLILLCRTLLKRLGRIRKFEGNLMCTDYFVFFVEATV